MGAGMLVLIIVGITTCLSLVAYADQGYGTFYTPPYAPSACEGYTGEGGNMIGAASDTLWNDGGACGSYYTITCIGAINEGEGDQPCTGQSVTIQIVDYCPPGCQGTIDLSQEAFAIIADPVAGKIVINYDLN